MSQNKFIGHMCGNYPWSSVHKDLVLALEGLGIGSQVYIPVAEHSDKQYRNYNSDLVKLIHFKISKRIIRYFPLTKVIYFSFVALFAYRKQLIKPRVFLSHTLWSDGFICLVLKFVFGIKYVVCVRNTDINIHIKYLWIYRPIQRLICSNSESIVFISTALKKNALSRYPYVFSNFESKSLVIPNGLCNEYINDIYPIDKHISSDIIKCCFVGRADKNKNIRNVIESLALLSQRGYSVSLDIVGSSFYDLKKLGVETYPWMSIHSYISDISNLKYIYRCSDILVVPSFRETFGLVYVEAISQGCFALCSGGQGVDGMFENFNVLYSTNPYSLESISKTILIAKSNHSLKNSDTDLLELYLISEFSWSSVAQKYSYLFNYE